MGEFADPNVQLNHRAATTGRRQQRHCRKRVLSYRIAQKYIIVYVSRSVWWNRVVELVSVCVFCVCRYSRFQTTRNNTTHGTVERPQQRHSFVRMRCYCATVLNDVVRHRWNIAFEFIYTRHQLDEISYLILLNSKIDMSKSIEIETFVFQGGCLVLLVQEANPNVFSTEKLSVIIYMNICILMVSRFMVLVHSIAIIFDNICYSLKYIV